MTDTDFSNLNDLEDIRAAARGIHAVSAIRRLACTAIANGETNGPHPTAFAGTLAALDDLMMGLAEDVQATAGEVNDRLKARAAAAQHPASIAMAEALRANASQYVAAGEVQK